MHRHKAGHAAAFGKFAAHGVAGALGRHHDDIDAGFWLDQAEMHVQAVGESNGRTFAQIIVHVFLICLRLKLIGHCEHDDIAPRRGLGDAHDLEALTFGLGGRRRAFTQGDDKVLGATVAQVQRMGVALRAIAKDGDFLVFDEVHIAIAIVINAHSHSPLI